MVESEAESRSYGAWEDAEDNVTVNVYNNNPNWGWGWGWGNPYWNWRTRYYGGFWLGMVLTGILLFGMIITGDGELVRQQDSIIHTYMEGIIILITEENYVFANGRRGYRNAYAGRFGNTNRRAYRSTLPRRTSTRAVSPRKCITKSNLTKVYES